MNKAITPKKELKKRGPKPKDPGQLKEKVTVYFTRDQLVKLGGEDAVKKWIYEIAADDLAAEKLVE